MKKRFLAVVLALVLCLTLIPATAFAAEGSGLTASGWAMAELTEAQERGIIPESLIFNDLKQKINRAEFAAVSVKVYESLTGTRVTVAGDPFTDTNDAEVLKAYAVGITRGTSDTTFSPEVSLSREEAATMLARVLKKIADPNWTIQEDDRYSLVYTKGSLFADNDKISKYALDSVYFMAAKSIIGGTGNNMFSPNVSATRQEAILIALRMTKAFDGVQIDSLVSVAAAVTNNTESYVPAGFDWNGSSNSTEVFISGKWLSADKQSALYISKDDGPDTFTLWYYSNKTGYTAKAVYEMQFADVLFDGKAECGYAGLTFTGVRGGLLVESDWSDELYSLYGSPDGIYTLVEMR